MDPFRDTVSMLAHQVLGHLEYDRKTGEHFAKPHSGASDPRLAGAKMTIDLRLESMVRGICQQIWVDSAAVAANAEGKVREALSEANIDLEIAKAVKLEMDNMRSWIAERVRKRIYEAVDRAIDERIGGAPKLYAKRITDRMWTSYFGKPPGRSNIYGRTRAPRTKKR